MGGLCEAALPGAEILPVPYFHVVFTLPVEIAAIAFCNRRVVFNVLFRTAAETLRTIAKDPRHGGVRIGGTAVLHTWDQKLLFHPHLHVVVPNAGFDVDSGEWKTSSGTFLAPVKVLASLFRRRFLEELARAHGRGELGFHGTVAYLHNPGEFHAALAAARSRDWVAYAKRPFRGPEQVFTLPPPLPLHPQDRHLGQPHRRRRRRDGLLPVPKAQETGAAQAALRHRHAPRGRVHPVRFLLHVLPDGLHRIRHFGIFANGSRAKTLESARRAIGAIGCPVDESVADETPEGDHGRDETPQFGTAPVSCPHCGAVLRHVNQISRQHRSHRTRGPPDARPNQGPQP